MAEEDRISIPRVSYEGQGAPGESRVFLGAPDFRVFIWGIEVSTDVFSVSTTLAMNENVSTAMVNIVNDGGKWVLPTSFATTGIDTIPDEVSESVVDQLQFPLGTNTKRGKYITPMKFAKMKRRNMLRKLKVESEGGTTIAQLLINKSQNSQLFPFLPGRPIIQMNDPIRIFFKNPWKFDDDEWYFAFTGYIAAVTEDFDSETNRSILRCSCEDIRRLLRYMRTSTNPNVFNMNVLENDTKPITANGMAELQKKLTSRAADMVMMTGNNALSAGMVIARRDEKDPPGVMELLLEGDTDQLVAARGSKKGDIAPFVSGVLGFQKGQKKIVSLTVDDNYEGHLSDTLNELYPILTSLDVSLYGSDWALGDVNVNPLAEANRFWVILPDKNHFPNLMDPFRWDMRIDFFSEFRSRLDIINEFVKNIDCVWYATPKGDIVLEFPDYDALPQLHANPWNSILTLQNEFTRFSSTEDDRSIKTLTIVVGSAIEGQETSELPFTAYYPHRNPELIARYGIREQRADRPYPYKVETINDALDELAAMWQELANADAYRLEGLEMLPNFRAVPGRPYMFKYRNIIGFAESIQHQIVWGELAQTTYNLKYLRHYDAKVNDWQKLSGNYGWHWKRKRGVEEEKGPKSIRGRKNPTKTDDAVQSLVEIHRSIFDQERVGGKPILTAEQHGRMNQIIRKMRSQDLSPEERSSLMEEFGGITAQKIPSGTTTTTTTSSTTTTTLP